MTTTEGNTELKTSLEINNTTKENINDSTASTEQSIPNSSFPNSYFLSGMVPLPVSYRHLTLPTILLV